jgi:hypothetical protein
MINLYRYKKGNAYALLYLATHTETLEKLAVYKALYGNGVVWCRPLEMFMEGGRFTSIKPSDLTETEFDALTNIPGAGD